MAVAQRPAVRQSLAMRQQALTAAKVLVLSAALSVFPTRAAPPPPVLTPPELDEPVDGYDMRGPYQIWRYWVESRKGPVTEALLAEPEELAGLTSFGLLLRFKMNNDFGHYLTGEIRSYCEPRPDARYTPLPGSCIYVLRRAYVPLNAASYGEPNPLSEWTRANFDAQQLARHFREIGLTPGSNWWSADREAMFVSAASPRAVLAANAKVIRLASTECPQMQAAIEALEGQSLGAAIDFVAVGRDEQLRPPRPHAVRSIYTIHLRADEGPYTVEGWAGPAARMANPILNAADKCERDRQSGD